jgi:hypothetical protein
VKVNPVADLRGPDLLPRPKVKHHAGITDPQQLGALLRAIEAYPGGFVVRQALRFAPLVSYAPASCAKLIGMSLIFMTNNPSGVFPQSG